LGHRFEKILNIAAQLAARPELVPCPVRFTFHGGGKRRGEIEEFIARNPTARVELHDYASAIELGAHLRSADVHLVSLATEWTGTMLPSKLQGIFQAGRPVLFLGDTHSSLGRWVAESGGGWVAATDDSDSLLHHLSAATNRLGRLSRGDQAANFARQHFDRTINARRLATHFTAPASC
jgi:colanic acid biosynthesis glycosyl transferase WcaI